jgi:hypothetical protein
LPAHELNLEKERGPAASNKSARKQHEIELERHLRGCRRVV